MNMKLGKPALGGSMHTLVVAVQGWTKMSESATDPSLGTNDGSNTINPAYRPPAPQTVASEACSTTLRMPLDMQKRGEGGI